MVWALAVERPLEQLAAIPNARAITPQRKDANWILGAPIERGVLQVAYRPRNGSGPA